MTDDPHTHYYSRERRNRLVRLIIALWIIVLLVAPVFALYEIDQQPSQEMHFISIVVLMLFTIVFAAVLAAFTRAKRHEVFAATSA